MKQNESEKVCFQYVCPRYPECARARGKGCCIDYPEEEELLIRKEDCNTENGFPLFAADN